MIGLDINILIRFFTRDDSRQWKRVDAYLKANCTSENPGWVACVVLCEVVWVLSRGYKYPKPHVINLLQQLVVTAEIKIESHDGVRSAISNYEKGKADFSDYLIGQLNRQNGCESTVTFDKKAASHTAFTLLPG